MNSHARSPGLLCCLAMLSCIGTVSAAGTRPALAAAIESCMQRLQPQDDIGFARIAARCPDLSPRLAAGALAPWLPRGWDEPRNDLSAGSLSELLVLQQQWLAADVPRGAAAQPAQLRAVIRELGLQAAQRNSLWKRFRSWLRSLSERRPQTDRESTSLSEWLSNHGLSEDLWSMVQWIALVLLGLLVSRAVLQELRVLRRQRRRRDGPLPLGFGAEGVPTLTEIDAAPLLRQPGMLLALIADTLARRRQLAGAAALTAREVVAGARLDNAADLTPLSELAAAAEPVRFGHTPPGDSLLRRTVAAGRALSQRLLMVEQR